MSFRGKSDCFLPPPRRTGSETIPMEHSVHSRRSEHPDVAKDILWSHCPSVGNGLSLKTMPFVMEFSVLLRLKGQLKAWANEGFSSPTLPFSSFLMLQTRSLPESCDLSVLFNTYFHQVRNGWRTPFCQERFHICHSQRVVCPWTLGHFHIHFGVGFGVLFSSKGRHWNQAD